MCLCVYVVLISFIYKCVYSGLVYELFSIRGGVDFILGVVVLYIYD